MKNNKNTTMKNLKKIVKTKNKSLTSIAVELEVSQEAISQYISGKIKPKTATIIEMAKLLNTTTDYLLDLTDNPTPPDFILSDKELSLITNYRSLDNEEKIKVETYIQAMLDLKKD
ncbi:MAG: helix-turn-helix transcriptional regulator [Firmicutes bacterium]|nr:helix-turn-helix transcriptional regulator [Bacillota bacterium]